jgi:DNA-binding response OmpR family regulator
MSAANEMPAAYRPCLIVAHASPNYASETCRSFRRLGWDVYQAQRGPEVRRLARMLDADLVILDVGLLEETGWLTCAKLVQERPRSRVILVTSDPSPRDQALAEFVGACAVVAQKDGLAALVPLAARTPTSAAG